MARKSRSKQRGKGVGTRSGTGGGSSNKGGGNKRGSGKAGKGTAGGGQKSGGGSPGKKKTTNKGPRGRGGAGTGGGQKTSPTKKKKYTPKTASSYRGAPKKIGNLPSNYKKTEQKAFKEAEAFKRKQAAERKRQLSINLKKFDAESYLNRYKDLRDAFGTDKAAARRHYITHGFNEKRDISKFTSAPEGAFGISAAGKKQAEANKLSYQRANDPIGFAARNAGVKNLIGAAGEDVGKLAGYAYNKDIAGRDLVSLGKGFADFVTRDKYDIDKLGKESFLSEANEFRKGAMEALKIGTADDKREAFTKADPKALANLGIKSYDMALNSSIIQKLGEGFGLPSNFKDQIDQSKEGFQKNYLDKIKIGDYDSTRKAISDFGANIGRDPDIGFIGRSAYQATEGAGNWADKVLASFQDGTQVDAEGNKIAASPSIKGLNKEQMGIMGSLYNYFGSNMATDIAMENYKGDIHTDLPQGEGFDAVGLVKFAQNIAGNVDDPKSVTSKTGGKLVENVLGIGKGGPSPGGLIKGVTGLNIGGGGKAITTTSSNNNNNTATETDTGTDTDTDTDTSTSTGTGTGTGTDTSTSTSTGTSS